jgi:hypothetical protein
LSSRKIFRVITSEGESVFIVIVLFVFIGHNYIANAMTPKTIKLTSNPPRKQAIWSQKKMVLGTKEIQEAAVSKVRFPLPQLGLT